MTALQVLVVVLTALTTGLVGYLAGNWNRAGGRGWPLPTTESVQQPTPAPAPTTDTRTALEVRLAHLEALVDRIARSLDHAAPTGCPWCHWRSGHAPGCHALASSLPTTTSPTPVPTAATDQPSTPPAGGRGGLRIPKPPARAQVPPHREPKEPGTPHTPHTHPVTQAPPEPPYHRPWGL